MKLMRYSLTLALGILTQMSIAQVTSSHPLSSNGIGTFNSGANAITSALGNVNSVWIDSTNVNFFNPSSYARLSKGNTLLSLGLDSRFSFYQQLDVSEFKTSTMFDHSNNGIQFGFLQIGLAATARGPSDRHGGS